MPIISYTIVINEENKIPVPDTNPLSIYASPEDTLKVAFFNKTEKLVYVTFNSAYAESVDHPSIMVDPSREGETWINTSSGRTLTLPYSLTYPHEAPGNEEPEIIVVPTT